MLFELIKFVFYLIAIIVLLIAFKKMSKAEKESDLICKDKIRLLSRIDETLVCIDSRLVNIEKKIE